MDSEKSKSTVKSNLRKEKKKEKKKEVDETLDELDIMSKEIKEEFSKSPRKLAYICNMLRIIMDNSDIADDDPDYSHLDSSFSSSSEDDE